MFGLNLVFCPNLSFVWICRCSESSFRSGVSLGPSLSFIWFSVRLRLWSEFFSRIFRWSKSGFHCGFVLAPNLVSDRVGLESYFFFGLNLSLVRIFLVSTCLWSEFVATPSVIFGPDLSLVWLWFSIRIGLRSETGFRSRVSSVRICLLCTFVFGPNFSVAFIWFSVRLCLWSEFVFSRFCRYSKTAFHCGFVFGLNLVFGPNLSLVLVFLWSENVFSPNFFGPNLSLVQICRRTKCDFRSGFVFGPTLFFDSNLTSFRIWFSVRSFVWSEFVFCALLFLVRTCRWSLSGFRYDFVFAPILSLIQILFSLRICVWSESCFRAEFFFSPIFSVVAICL